MKPTISIVIRCKNEEKSIGEVLARTFEQVSPVPYEVLVLDSGSTDRTLEIANRFNVRLFTIEPGNFNFSYALNYMIDLAQGEIICCLSAHCLPHSDRWLMELTKPILSGQTEATIGKQLPIKGMNPFEEVAILMMFPLVTPQDYSPHLSNANCAFQKKLWEEKKFDEDIFGWEDYFWYLQMKPKYRFLYCPEAAVYHSHPFNFKYWLTRSYSDGKAAHYIYNQTGLDVTGGDLHSFRISFKHFLFTFFITGTFLFREGYFKMLLLLPLVKPLLYISYLRGAWGKEAIGRKTVKNEKAVE